MPEVYSINTIFAQPKIVAYFFYTVESQLQENIRGLKITQFLIL